MTGAVPALYEVAPPREAIEAALERGCDLLVYPVAVGHPASPTGRVDVWACARSSDARVRVLVDREGRPIPGPQEVRIPGELLKPPRAYRIGYEGPAGAAAVVNASGYPVIVYELTPAGTVRAAYVGYLGELVVRLPARLATGDNLVASERVLAELEPLREALERLGAVEEAGRERA